MSIPDQNIRSLKAMIIYGLKGMAAYYKHALVLGYSDEEIADFIQKTLVATVDEELTVEQLLDLVMKTGQTGVKAMALLDKANTQTYGHPEISKVNLGVRDNPAIHQRP